MPPASTALVSYAPRLDNLSPNELLYQRFVLVTGTVGSSSDKLSDSSYVSVASVSFPVQTFPCSPETGEFKALVHLQPGPQDITFSFNGNDSSETSTRISNVMYLPLLHVPPLHLAIMVAEDSPMFMDCPPEKAGSSSHRDLAAAVKKMRMWAYMCQAYTAEEMRKNGFGRRSFRLEEEWTQDTLSIQDEEPKLRVTAKVHIVKADVTNSILRDPDVAQQNPDAHQKDQLHEIFGSALQKYGGPFENFPSDPHGPVVAGLILDSHYDPLKDLILAHAALGGTCGPFHKMHLGMFGSHTHWAWPRFVEEIAPCLLDSTRVTARSRVANDCGQCGTFWEACCIGQGASLHEVGHAFGLSHQSSGIMERGYVEWNRSFVAIESYCERTKEGAKSSVPSVTSNHWHLADILHMATHHMFVLPTDHSAQSRFPLSVQLEVRKVVISSKAGVALLEWSPAGRSVVVEDVRGQEGKLEKIELVLDELQTRFGNAGGEKTDTPAKLAVVITALDGVQKTIEDFWDFVTSGFVTIPGSELTVKKRGVISNQQRKQDVWKWAVLLTKLDKERNVVKANRIQIQTGAWFDGCYVYYDDNTREIMGPKARPNGMRMQLGGGTTNLLLHSDEEITSVDVGYGRLINAAKFHTSKASEGITAGVTYNHIYESLKPDDNERIVGFYGKNEHDGGFCATIEFGILTIPKDKALPDQAYRLPELSNTDGGSQTNKNYHGDVDEMVHDDQYDSSIDLDEADESNPL